MRYEINVSKSGRHFFATHARSITTQRELNEAYKVFCEKFPEDEGYKVTVSKKVEEGYTLDMDEWIKGYNEGREVA